MARPQVDTDSLLLLQVPHHEENLPVRHGIPKGAHDVEGVLQKKISAPLVVRSNGATDQGSEDLFQGFLQKEPADPACPVFLLDEQVLYFRHVPSSLHQGDAARYPAVLKRDVIAALEYGEGVVSLDDLPDPEDGRPLDHFLE